MSCWTRTRPLGIRYVVIGRPLTGRRSAAARATLTGRTSVLIGHSGVGKSTLVNALIPDADRAIGHGQRGDRPGAAHVVVGGGAAAARARWLGDRHPGLRVLRAGPRDPRPGRARRSPTWPAG